MNYKNEKSLKKGMKKSNSQFLKLKTNSDNQNKLSLFLRNQDFYLYNLLNKKGLQKNTQPEILYFNQNNNDLPSIKIKKIINIGRNGFYSFKKIDYNYNVQNKKYTKEIEKMNNYLIVQHNKKTLLRHNSCHMFNIKKNIFDKYYYEKRINSPLIITHINKVNKVKKTNNKINKNIIINKNKRCYSSKSVQKEDIKRCLYDKINNRNICYNMTVYKKNEATQINHFYDYKDNDLFLSEKKINNMKIDYCSPKSIIFQKK